MSRCKFKARQFLLSAIILINFVEVFQQGVTQSLGLTYCAKESTESTLKTFWQNNNRKCPKDPQKLLELYDVMANEAKSAKAADKCNHLLQHHVRKTIIEVSANVIAEALIATQSLQNKGPEEVQQLIERIAQSDERMAQAVWERVIDELYLFVSSDELAALLVDNYKSEANVAALLYLYWKGIGRADLNTRLQNKMAYQLQQMRSAGNFKQFSIDLRKRLNKTWQSLPAELRTLYSRSTSNVVRLLNIKHWEYLYAPRENGPDELRRIPLTWSQDKNQTDSDGNLRLELRQNSDVAFSNRFGAAFKYLYADVDQSFFWIGSGTKENRWWHPEWQDDGYFTFKNTETGRLLCATLPYDENRRYVSLLREEDDAGNDEASCGWLVVLVS